MTQWKIVFDEVAKKELKKLDRQAQFLIQNFLYTRILTLSHPKFCGKALSANRKGYWRYRVDKFRIVCKLEEHQLVVLVVKIAKRDVVYED